eukprot:5938830-Pyramimonas_sp.AAC.1
MGQPPGGQSDTECEHSCELLEKPPKVLTVTSQLSLLYTLQRPILCIRVAGGVLGHLPVTIKMYQETGGVGGNGSCSAGRFTA